MSRCVRRIKNNMKHALDGHLYDQKLKCQNRKSKMLKSKIRKIQGSSVRGVLSTPPSLCLSEGGAQSRYGAKHSPLFFASKILGDPKGCSRASNIWCIFSTSMLNLKIILQTIFNVIQVHFSFDNVL